MDTANLLALLGLLGGVVVTAWMVYQGLAKKMDSIVKDNEDRIKRVYSRQDEIAEKILKSQSQSIEKIEKEFMRVDAHNLSMQHVKEVMEVKSNATVQLFTTRLDNLTDKINELINRINHRENGTAQ